VFAPSWGLILVVVGFSVGLRGGCIKPMNKIVTLPIGGTTCVLGWRPSIC
jgi:hypothetical protein